MLKEISLAAIFVATMGASTAMANEHDGEYDGVHFIVHGTMITNNYTGRMFKSDGTEIFDVTDMDDWSDITFELADGGNGVAFLENNAVQVDGEADDKFVAIYPSTPVHYWKNTYTAEEIAAYVAEN